MPELKNNFTRGRMNKDLDPRLLPKGEYRQALNIEVSTSEAQGVGTLRNILGNLRWDRDIDNNFIVPNGFRCVGSIADEQKDRLYWLITSAGTDAILEWDETTGLTRVVVADTNKTNSRAILKFPVTPITGINIIDDFLLYTDNRNEPRKINVERCAGGTVDLNSTTNLFVNNVNVGRLQEENICVIKKRPRKALDVQINSTNNLDAKNLFEKVIPRFCYRYKYIDGEYSSYSPFTKPVVSANYSFNKNINNAYSIKDGFNTAMQNTIQSLELTGFIQDDMPNDVVEVNILYKEDGSNTVYSVANIKMANQTVSAEYIDEYNLNGLGSYNVTTENVYAAVEESQLLRTWDNVPKKALAQEIIGNRVVYANYFQGYDIEQQRVNVIANYEKRKTLRSFLNGGVESIKSQRDYQIGVVYGDAFGRETPVFTSPSGSIKVPFKDSNIVGSVCSSKAINLNASLSNYKPDFADYVKFYIKESSGEYYNMIMDTAFIPGVNSEFENKDEHLWLAFPSSDINKIQEQDYLILKKVIGTDNSPISIENRYKVIDIKPEAPDSIAFNYFNLGSEANGEDNLSSTILETEDQTINKTTDVIRIEGSQWRTNGHVPLPTTDNATTTQDKEGKVYISWKIKDPDDASKFLHSKKYRVTNVSIQNQDYILKLSTLISSDDAALASSTDVANPDGALLKDTLIFTCERKDKREGEDFSGKFFVKIISDDLIYNSIIGPQEELTDNQFIASSSNVGFLSSTGDNGVTGEFDGIFNDLNFAITSNANFIQAQDAFSGLFLNSTGDWEALLNPTNDSFNAIEPSFFIDQVYMAASNPSSSYYAKESGQGWRGNDIFYGAANWTVSDDSTLNWSFANESYGGSENTFGQVTELNTENWILNVFNGLPGVITADNTHIENGFKQWKESSIYENDYDNTYGDEAGGFFMHLSFLAPGKDLHDGSFVSETSDTGLNNTDVSGINSLARSMQGVWGGGAFTTSSGNEIDGQLVEFEGNYDVAGALSTEPGPSVGQGYSLEHEELHNRQWDPTFNANGDEDNKILDFVNNITPGAKFKFKADTDNVVYTITKVTEKHIYNHTPWKARYIYNGANIVQAQDSVEEAAIAWATSTVNGSSDAIVTANGTALKEKIEDFGKAHNRRTCYIIQLDKDPRESSFDPTNSISVDANDFTQIQFLDEKTQALAALKSEASAIFETEPKEAIDLNIYYEASDAIPLRLNEDNIRSFAPIGSRVEIMTPRARSGAISVTEEINVNNWIFEEGDEFDGVARLELTSGFNVNDINNSIIEYGNIPIRFYNEAGGYNTANLSFIEFDDDANTDLGLRVNFLVELDVNTQNTFGLSWNNIFSFGNGIESSRIRDDFNAPVISNGARASTTLEEPYSEEHRKYGLIYSGIYNSISGVNNLNQFIQAQKITKDVNPSYGSIQKLFSRDSDLVAFCEDKVLKILANKDAIFNADGNPQLIATENVLGQVRPFVGDYGISKNPESFAKESYRAYFADRQRGAVLRLSMDGLTPISDAGMSNWFRDNLKTVSSILGTYDEYKSEYNITLRDGYYSNILQNSYFNTGAPTSTLSELISYILNYNLTSGNEYSNVNVETVYASEQMLPDTIEYNGPTFTFWPAIPAGGLFPGVTGVAAVAAGTDTPAQYPDFALNRYTMFRWTNDNEGHFPGSTFTGVAGTNSGGGAVWGAGTATGAPFFIERGRRVDGVDYQSFLTGSGASTPTSYGINTSPSFPANINDLTAPASSPAADAPFVVYYDGSEITSLPEMGFMSGGGYLHDYIELSPAYGEGCIVFATQGGSVNNNVATYIKLPNPAVTPYGANFVYSGEDIVTGGTFGSANNTTVFNGEEFYIGFKYSTRYGDSSSETNSASEQTRIKVTLFDGNTPVSGSIIVNPGVSPSPVDDVIDFSTATNTNPYSNQFVNDVTSSAITGDIFDAGVAVANNAEYIWPDSDPNLEDIVYSPSNNGAARNAKVAFKVSDDTNDQKILINNLQVRFEVLNRNGAQAIYLLDIFVRKMYRMVAPAQSFIPGDAAIDFVQGYDPIPATDRPAFITIDRDISDISNTFLPITQNSLVHVNSVDTPYVGFSSLDYNSLYNDVLAKAFNNLYVATPDNSGGANTSSTVVNNPQVDFNGDISFFPYATASSQATPYHLHGFNINRTSFLEYYAGQGYTFNTPAAPLTTFNNAVPGTYISTTGGSFDCPAALNIDSLNPDINGYASADYRPLVAKCTGLPLEINNKMRTRVFAYNQNISSGESQNLYYDLTGDYFVDGRYYAIDVEVDQLMPEAIAGTDDSGIWIPNVILQSTIDLGIANVNHLDNNPNYPEGYVGVINDSNNGIELMQIETSDYTTNSLFTYRAVFQYLNSSDYHGSCGPNGTDVANSLRIQFWGTENNPSQPDSVHSVKSIKLFDATAATVSSSVDNWDLSISSIPVTVFQEPSLYYDNSSIIWNNNSTNLDTASQATVLLPDIITVSFTIAGFNVTGTLLCEISRQGQGAIISIDKAGYYEYTINFNDNTFEALEHPNFEDDDLPLPIAIVFQPNAESEGIYFTPSPTFKGVLQNARIYNEIDYLTGGSVDFWTTSGFDLDQYDYIVFDDNLEQVQINNSPATFVQDGYSLLPNFSQTLSQQLLPNLQYQIIIQSDLSASTQPLFIYYKTIINGQDYGFRIVHQPSDFGQAVYNVELTPLLNTTLFSGELYYRVQGVLGYNISTTFVVNGDSENFNYIPITEDQYNVAISHENLYNTLVVYAGFPLELEDSAVFNSLSEDEQQETLINGYISLISLSQITNNNSSGNYNNLSILGDPKTLSFSESVKGWTSFKSFTPEEGLSLSRSYFTFFNGRLYKHYSNNLYNTFYNSHERSHIVTSFNDSPSTVKRFETLGYEGSQDWVCSDFRTNLDYGSNVGFIKKEDKWFNYLNQALPFSHTNTLLDGQIDLGTSLSNTQTSHFNFEKSSVQGLGVANFCTVIIELDAEGNVVNPLGTSPLGTPITGPVADNLIINQQLVLSGEAAPANAAQGPQNLQQLEANLFTGFREAIEIEGSFSTVVNIADLSNIINY